MAENGACFTQVDSFWFVNGVADPVTVQSSFNFGTPTGNSAVAANAGAPIVSGNKVSFNLQDNM